jgi:hypothetical protein
MARSARSAHCCLAVLAVVCATAAATAVLQASDQAIAVTRFQATVRGSTSLRVSDSVLVVNPPAAGFAGPVVAGTIEFRAGARTTSDGEVLLTVEATAPLATLTGGASDSGTAVAFEGSGDGARSGELRDTGPEAAARWTGSGLRTGRLTFVVRGPIAPQGAILPVRFVLTAP